MSSLTLVVEKRGKFLWLCTSDGIKEVPVARFVSRDAAESFKDAFALAKMSMHAMGIMGI